MFFLFKFHGTKIPSLPSLKYILIFYFISLQAKFTDWWNWCCENRGPQLWLCPWSWAKPQRIWGPQLPSSSFTPHSVVLMLHTVTHTFSRKTKTQVYLELNPRLDWVVSVWCLGGRMKDPELRKRSKELCSIFTFRNILLFQTLLSTFYYLYFNFFFLLNLQCF